MSVLGLVPTASVLLGGQRISRCRAENIILTKKKRIQANALSCRVA